MKYLILMLLIGCGKSPNKGYTTPQLQAIITEFEQDFDLNVDYPVVFVKTFSSPGVPNQIGVCIRNSFIRTVEILSTYEESNLLSPIVYHELGHCSLDLDHHESGLDIMNSGLSYSLGNNFEFYRNLMINNYFDNIYP